MSTTRNTECPKCGNKTLYVPIISNTGNPNYILACSSCGYRTKTHEHLDDAFDEIENYKKEEK